MTRNEIIEKYNELLSTNGKLTHDDYITLGVMHRELPQNERNWEWLTVTTCYPNTAESYRALVKRYMKANKINVEVDMPSQSVNEMHELYKERQRLRDERTTLNRQLRDEARFISLKETIEKSIKDLPKLVTENFYLNNALANNWQSSSEAILMLSDWHIGQDCNNFYNKYDVKIAEKRVCMIVDKTINYCKKFGIEKLHVLNLGDLIEGTINNTGRIDSNENALNQLMIATELLANALNKLKSYVKTVTYRSVTDNHGNITSNKKDRIPEESLNRLTTWYLKARLSESDIQFKDDNLDEGLGRFSLDNGMKVAFFHGHEDSKDKTLQNLVGATHEWTDVVCSAHLHNPAEHVYQDMRLFINGSLCGTGPYALSHRMYNHPSQKLIIVEDDNFLNFDLSAHIQ